MNNIKTYFEWYWNKREKQLVSEGVPFEIRDMMKAEAKKAMFCADSNHKVEHLIQFAEEEPELFEVLKHTDEFRELISKFEKFFGE